MGTKRNYNLSHRLIACILFIGLFLQSCSGFKNQTAPQEEKQPIRAIELSEHLLVNTNKEFVTSGGYLASFYEEDGGLKADLKADEKQPEPNYKGVPVVFEEGADLTSLAKLDFTTQKNRIELKRSHSGQLSHMIIRKGGILGGMLEGDEENGKDEEKEKEESIPHEYLCPISHEIMQDPVIALDGHTYERVEIQKWFDRGNFSSPITGVTLPNTTLLPNYNIRKMINDFKAKQITEIIMFCGNPGVGKSTLCNSIFGQAIFESGISLGKGMTTHKQEHAYENKLYIDTPGLADVEMREQAAKEIQKALKHNNNYKLIFVAMLDSGRIRAADLLTINTVCDAIKTDFEYGIVFNQVMRKVIRELDQKGLTPENTCNYLSELGLHKKPSQVIILTRDDEIEGAENKYFESKSKNRERLLGFIDQLNANRIAKNNVKDIDITNYEEKLKAMEEEYKRKITELQVIIRNQKEEIKKEMEETMEEKMEEKMKEKMKKMMEEMKKGIEESEKKTDKKIEDKSSCNLF